ncbi:hypothetical protein PMIT1342_01997 [Prochlorococcus marinus str. MIT 1342]|uniref:hypothetical protein n=1 Tax=Prochlorococcus TaxID=1218 RepID=UPI0007B348FD|nr:hypothetical protein [Prochlorococcus marinus]KZR80051.1 hypothetical protein PMIT1342_01997 [Prochlorococcus marinus str. MIT 1342]
MDGGLAVGNTDNAEVDDLTSYFSLSSTAFIVDVDSGEQIPIRFPGDRNPFVTHTAYGICTMATILTQSRAALVR